MSRRDRLPYFPFYPADWLADAEVRAMTLAQRGAYIDLLAIGWREDGLPDDVPSLARMIGGKPALVKQVLAIMYVKRGGRFRNKRQESERKAAQATSRKRAAAGSKGGKARVARLQPGHDSATARPKHSDSDSDSDSNVQTLKKSSQVHCTTCYGDGERWGLVKHLAGTRDQVTCKCPRGRERAKRVAQEREAKERGRRTPRKRGERPAPSKVKP